MRALRRVPEAAEALRTGALSVTTLALLEDVLTPENAAEVMEPSAFESKREVEQLAATLRPRPAPKEGLRRLSTAPPAGSALPLAPPPLAAPPPPAHQLLSAEQTFGRAHMDGYRPRRGEREATSPGGSAAGGASEERPPAAELFPPGGPS